MLCPIKHHLNEDIEFPVEGWHQAVEDICRREKALFILDDIRCGFRYHLRGTHRYFNARPDLTCFGKAMSNGYEISVTMGKDYLKETAKSVFHNATYFFAAVGMAASLATLKIIERDGVIKKIHETSMMLKKGILEQAKEFGLDISYSGTVMPYLRFIDDSDSSMIRLFCGEAAKRGIYLHPYHNWNICAAHTSEDIEKALEVARNCFAIVAQSKKQ
ncbi:MAG: aminotransferase class III-fold pyridoxal phosphate-dependent enzyme [Desulfocucumaceae bacterium]